jgi:hypothetical protein
MAITIEVENNQPDNDKQIQVYHEKNTGGCPNKKCILNATGQLSRKDFSLDLNDYLEIKVINLHPPTPNRHKHWITLPAHADYELKSNGNDLKIYTVGNRTKVEIYENQVPTWILKILLPERNIANANDNVTVRETGG